jgi:hypothetical protein
MVLCINVDEFVFSATRGAFRVTVQSWYRGRR